MRAVTQAIAAVLVGWYLMFPPSMHLGAPLREWQTARAAFDTAQECNAARQALLDGLKNTAPAKTKADLRAGMALRDAMCIAWMTRDSRDEHASVIGPSNV